MQKLRFIVFVYSILFIQACLDLVIVADVVKLVPAVDEFLKSKPALYDGLGVLIGAIAILLTIRCNKNARKSPKNGLALFFFTLCRIFIVGLICSYLSMTTALIVVGMITWITLVLILHGCIRTH